jgi:hypothetical protein
MFPNLVIQNDKACSPVDWSKNIHIDNKYITRNKNTRANIKSLDRTKLSSKFLVQIGTSNTDNFKILFGISCYGGHKSERSDLNIDLTGESANTLKSLDEFIVDEVIRRKTDFFEPERSTESIKSGYYGCVKEDREGKYNPNLKCKITLGSDESLNTKVFQWVQAGEESIENKPSIDDALIDVDSEESIRDLIVPKTQCMCIIQIQSLWFKNDNWGVGVEARLLGVFPHPKDLQFFIPPSNQSDEEKDIQDLEDAFDTPQFAPM